MDSLSVGTSIRLGKTSYPGCSLSEARASAPKTEFEEMPLKVHQPISAIAAAMTATRSWRRSMAKSVQKHACFCTSSS